MPKRKTLMDLPDYVGVSQDDSKLIVQKTNPLQTLSETSMTLAEFKILDAYLSKIDSHNENKRYVRFSKGELERMLGVDRIRRSDLIERLRNLFQAVTIRDSNKKEGFTLIMLFEKARAHQEENGQWVIDLCCSKDAMEYIFYPENLGYLKYRLKNVVNLSSRYSYVLYLQLERYRNIPYRNVWEVDIEELKEMMHCTAETYSQYKRFNDLILKKCQKEICEKTDLKFDYEPTKKIGRKFTALKFTIASEPGWENISNLFEEEVSSLMPYINACDGQFTEQQVEILKKLMDLFLPEKQQVSYLSQKFSELTYRIEQKKNTKNKKINNRFSYLKAMITNDCKDCQVREQKESDEETGDSGSAYDMEAYEASAMLNDDAF